MLDLRHPIISAAPTPASISMLSFLGNLASMDSASTTPGLSEGRPAVENVTPTGRSATSSLFASNMATAMSIPSYYSGLKSMSSENHQQNGSSRSPDSSPSPVQCHSPISLMGMNSNNPKSHSSPDPKSNSPIMNYPSSPELNSPVGGSFPGQSYPGLAGLPAFHPALQMQSLHHSLRNLHGLQGLASLSLPSVSKLPSPSPNGDLNKNKSVSEALAMNQQSPSSIFTNALHGKSSEPTSSSTSIGQSSPVSGTPHGIEHILSRPLPRLPTSTGQQFATGLPHPGFSGLTHPSATLNLSTGVGVGGLGLSSSGLTGVYWPTLPSFIGNPALQAWRDRLNSVGHNPNGLGDKDGKKKHTRPTFSGQQIFALEKTFEQTKYLAGPERAKLAYALGMTESQVKVWFQNRRTKWRKKHAAEMATAKRRQEEAEVMDDMSDKEDDIDDTSSDAKRRKVE